jgi:hypothetical protein
VFGGCGTATVIYEYLPIHRIGFRVRVFGGLHAELRPCFVRFVLRSAQGLLGNRDRVSLFVPLACCYTRSSARSGRVSSVERTRLQGPRANGAGRVARRVP